MNQPETMKLECAHSRIAGPVCLDCRVQLLGRCRNCGGGIAAPHAGAAALACSECGAPYPW